MLDDFEEGDDVEAFGRRLGQGQRLDGDVVVCEAAGFHEQRIGALVALCDCDDLGRGVYGCDGVCGRQAGGGLCEDAAAAADVEVFALLAWGERRRGAQAVVDEWVSVLVQKVENATRAMGIPPVCGESIEMGDFCRVDRAARLAVVGGVGSIGGRVGTVRADQMCGVNGGA